MVLCLKSLADPDGGCGDCNPSPFENINKKKEEKEGKKKGKQEIVYNKVNDYRCCVNRMQGHLNN